jgi:uncharacterized membrane protein (DUF4010 family)
MTWLALDAPGDLVNLGVALAVGLLIGLQRERQFARDKEKGPAGARTFPLVALFGGLSVVGAGGPDGPGFPWMPAAGLVGVGVLAAIAYRRVSDDKDSIGLTTEVLLLLTYVLGVAAAAGRPETAAIVGAAALVLAGLKDRLHGFAGRLTDEDETAAIKFVAIALLVLPFLPDADVGPHGGLNPYDIGLMAVLVAGVSFLGYVAVQALGPGRGLLVTGLLGGLASTTATTAAFARRSREDPRLSVALAAGTVAACVVLFPRVLVLVAVTNPSFLPALWPSVAATAAVTVLAAALGLLVLEKAPRVDVDLKNPFRLAPALWFALLYAGVVLATRTAEAWWGSEGLLATAAISGATDVDALTLTASRLERGGLAQGVLADAVVVGIVSNSLVKTGIAFALGSRAYAVRVGIALLATAAAGGVVVLWR